MACGFVVRRFIMEFYVTLIPVKSIIRGTDHGDKVKWTMVYAYELKDPTCRLNVLVFCALCLSSY